MRFTSGSFLQFLAEPLCLHESVLQQMFVQHLAQSNAAPLADLKADSGDDYLPTIDELIVADGIALIPIHGVMVKRSQIWHGWFSSRVIVGSDHWSTIIGDLINRTDIETLVFDFDTGGGQVAGTERLGDAIWKARQSGKRTIAVCNEFCASAGLWAAAQCEHVVIPATGSMGSLGVYTVHMDNTKAWQEYGFEKTVIHRGKYKGIDERPLDADSKADLQRFIDGKYSLFVDAVARGRGLNADEVTKRWGESQLFTGSEAVSTGLADEIGTLQDVLESLRAGRGGRVSLDAIPAGECDPSTDPTGEDEAMLKINMTGQILDKDGKAVGNVSELQIDAAGLTKYFAAQTGELIESAVKTAQEAAAQTQKAAVADADKARIAHLDQLVAAVGPEKAIAAFKAGQTVEAAKAGLADDLKEQLAAKDAEIAKLQQGNATSGKAPGFIASDSAGSGPAAAPAAAGERSEFAADWDANKDNAQNEFRNETEYAAYRRRHG
ncbi:S49 family peptidase [Candidatus Dependentiae bacterium]|nr:MAG: S49 family peptidase [Candidatus Dependentiae bacterium]